MKFDIFKSKKSNANVTDNKTNNNERDNFIKSYTFKIIPENKVLLSDVAVGDYVMIEENIPFLFNIDGDKYRFIFVFQLEDTGCKINDLRYIGSFLVQLHISNPYLDRVILTETKNILSPYVYDFSIINFSKTEYRDITLKTFMKYFLIKKKFNYKKNSVYKLSKDCIYETELSYDEFLLNGKIPPFDPINLEKDMATFLQ